MLEHLVSPDKAELIRDVVTYLSSYKLFSLTVVGVWFLYGINRARGKQPFSISMWIDTDIKKLGTFGKGMDMIVSSILGAIAVFLIAEPTTAKQAFVSGLGMTGILANLTKDTEQKLDGTKQRKLLRGGVDAEELKKGAQFAGRISLCSGLLSMASGLVLTFWFPAIGSILAAVLGGVFVVSLWMMVKRERRRA